jgi:molecular chaperone GrpE
MAKGNGKTDPRFVEKDDVERELPAGEEEATSGAGTVQRLETDGDGGLPETEKLKVERDALLDRLARLQAEFDNARKRAVREQQEFREYAAADVIKNFLPMVDSFELALKASGDAGDFRSGVELIYRQFQDALQKIGVQPIVAVGQVFDPRVHEAIEMVDTSAVPDHHVLEELQRGYKYKEKMLRPAMVRVARNNGG